MYIPSLLRLVRSADAPHAPGPRAGAGSLLRQIQRYSQLVCTNVLRNRFRGLRFFCGAAVSFEKNLVKDPPVFAVQRHPNLVCHHPLTATTVESTSLSITETKARRMRLGKLARQASLDHRLCIFRLVRSVPTPASYATNTDPNSVSAAGANSMLLGATGSGS